MAFPINTTVNEELRDRDVGEPEGPIEFAVGEQAAVGRDPGTVELELDPTVEGSPQRRLFGFTRLVSHDPPAPLTPTSSFK